MTAVDDAEMVACFLLVLLLPQLAGCVTMLFDIGIRTMTAVEAEVLTFMLIPIVVVCGIGICIIGFGHFIDSGGLDA